MLFVEAGATVLLVGSSFVWPEFLNKFFRRVETFLGGISRRSALSVAVVGCFAFLGRLAIVPYFPVPHPFIPDDYSFLLAADTFASGRLTNPTPAMWTHLESINISMQPTYNSMFFPGFGLVLAAGKVIFGNPWIGLLCATAVMCAATCWMLQAWLPPSWALLGGFLAVLRLGLFSFWINTYTGGGSVAALGGALVLGSLPRLRKRPRIVYGLTFAVGVLILANTRPYEGLLLLFTVVLASLGWALSGKNVPTKTTLIRIGVPTLALLLTGTIAMGYYNYRNFGSPFTLPYTVNRATYAVAQHFVWEPVLKEPAYRYKEIRDYYVAGELPEFVKFRTVSGFLTQSAAKLVSAFLFYAGVLFVPALFFCWRSLKDRRIRLLSLAMLPMLVGVLLEAGIRPYYLAPFTPAFYAIGLQSMRHLRQTKLGKLVAGATMVRLAVIVCVMLAALDVISKPLHIDFPFSGASSWTCECLGYPQPGSERSRIQNMLQSLPGKQLVLVRYSAIHSLVNEWVYNSPDIDDSKVIWARDMPSEDNSELLRYYKDRQVWLVQPDFIPAKLSPYPSSDKVALASR
jgi:hypothetical protein